jgi:selenocysteine lyase/cysteine desulfurase
LAHAAGARVVVDGVALAPHRALDVQAWNADWYVYSCYKVYGPHMGALFGTNEALSELEGPNHFFLPSDSIYKFEIGGVSHEGCAGLLAVSRYLRWLAGGDAGEAARADIERAFSIMTDLELPLQQRLIKYLQEKPEVRLLGPAHGGPERISTISFVPLSRRPRDVVAKIDERGIGIRWGHMYAYRLCRALGIDTDEGVVRVSMVHYNTQDEIERLIAALDDAL